MAQKNVLLILCEYRKWNRAKKWAYHCHIGITEALKHQDVSYTVLMSPWFDKAKEICSGKSFDQVWICDPTHAFDDDDAPSIIPEEILVLAAELAPVRLALLFESVRYTLEEYRDNPWLNNRKKFTEVGYLKYFTHIAAIDESDVEWFNDHFAIPAMWNPCSVPESLICDKPSPPKVNKAFFNGSLYGLRKQWLVGATDNFHKQLLHTIPKDGDKKLAKKFDKLPSHWLPKLLRGFLRMKNYNTYLDELYDIRRKGFLMWQREVLQYGSVVVNLPHFVKGYTARVTEGIAAGRPVVSWSIPNRPLNTALFEHEKEVYLFSDIEQLENQLDRLLNDPITFSKVTIQAQKKLRAYHTTEKRVQQIFTWIESGSIPSFC